MMDINLTSCTKTVLRYPRFYVCNKAMFINISLILAELWKFGMSVIKLSVTFMR